VLGICAAIHLICIVWWIEFLKKRINALQSGGLLKAIFLPIGGTFIVLVFSHTLQVWIWTLAFVGLGALPEIQEAIYFSLVTYTTLG